MNLDQARMIDDPIERAHALRDWQVRAEALMDAFRADRARTVAEMRAAGVPWTSIVAVFDVGERYLRTELAKTDG